MQMAWEASFWRKGTGVGGRIDPAGIEAVFQQGVDRGVEVIRSRREEGSGASSGESREWALTPPLNREREGKE